MIKYNFIGALLVAALLHDIVATPCDEHDLLCETLSTEFRKSTPDDGCTPKLSDREDLCEAFRAAYAEFDEHCVQQTAFASESTSDSVDLDPECKKVSDLMDQVLQREEADFAHDAAARPCGDDDEDSPACRAWRRRDLRDIEAVEKGITEGGCTDGAGTNMCKLIKLRLKPYKAICVRPGRPDIVEVLQDICDVVGDLVYKLQNRESHEDVHANPFVEGSANPGNYQLFHADEKLRRLGADLKQASSEMSDTYRKLTGQMDMYKANLKAMTKHTRILMANMKLMLTEEGEELQKKNLKRMQPIDHLTKLLEDDDKEMEAAVMNKTKSRGKNVSRENARHALDLHQGIMEDSVDYAMLE